MFCLSSGKGRGVERMDDVCSRLPLPLCPGVFWREVGPLGCKQEVRRGRNTTLCGWCVVQACGLEVIIQTSDDILNLSFKVRMNVG